MTYARGGQALALFARQNVGPSRGGRVHAGGTGGGGQEAEAGHVDQRIVHLAAAS